MPGPRPRVFLSLEELRAAVGEEWGPGGWLTVDQERVDRFAEATGDHQWIHTDPVRAASGPYGSTVAHGYLTLALLPVLVPRLVRVEGVRLAVNYGSDRVRFPAPLPVGSRVRATARLSGAEPVPGGLQVATTVRVEREGAQRPVCVAETLSRYYR